MFSTDVSSSERIIVPSYNKQDPIFYDQKALVQQKRALENLNSCHFEGNEDVMDLGCGNGAITAFIIV